jgi:hypothetical protein
MTETTALLDERAAHGFRDRFGRLAALASEVDVAATRVRLSLVDLSLSEVGSVRRLRVLLAEVNAVRLAAEAESVLADPGRARNLRLLIRLLSEGRILVRSAPLGGWAPDFSVFRAEGAPFSALIGVHSFLRPTPLPGPLFVSEHGRAGASAAASRFEELWSRSHDVSDPIRELLSRLDDEMGAPGKPTDGA